MKQVRTAIGVNSLYIQLKQAYRLENRLREQTLEENESARTKSRQQ